MFDRRRRPPGDLRAATLALAACLAVAAPSSALAATPKKILPNDSAPDTTFGESVAVSGGMAIVGASYDDGGGVSDAGSAYLFDIATGQQIRKLIASDGQAGDRFGRDVAIDGNLAVVGSNGSMNGSAFQRTGTAYLYDVSTGQELRKLTSPDVLVGEDFGCSVAIDGNTVLIGSATGTRPGVAYLFDAAAGQQLFKLESPSGELYDGFGHAVDVSGERAIVGAIGNPDSGLDPGTAYVFDVTTGQSLLTLAAGDGVGGDMFGASVAIEGNRIVVGAPLNADNASASGAAYVFDTTTGQQLFKLTPSDGGQDWVFGASVDISGNFAVVGAFGADQYRGAAYLFDLATGQELARFVASPRTRNALGGAVAVAGSVVAVGAVPNNYDGLNIDSAYLFAAVPEPSTLGAAWFGFLGALRRSSRRATAQQADRSGHR